MPFFDANEYEEQMEEMETAMEEIQRDVDALQLENQLFTQYLKVRVGKRKSTAYLN